MSTIDALRTLALSGAKFKKEVIDIEGAKFELRQPSQKDRKEIIEKAKTPNGEIDGFELMIWSMISKTYHPGTEDRVFKETDYDTIMATPAGGIIDKLGEAAVKLLNVEEDMGKK